MLSDAITILLPFTAGFAAIAAGSLAVALGLWRDARVQRLGHQRIS